MTWSIARAANLGGPRGTRRTPETKQKVAIFMFTRKVEKQGTLSYAAGEQRGAVIKKTSRVISHKAAGRQFGRPTEFSLIINLRDFCRNKR